MEIKDSLQIGKSLELFPEQIKKSFQEAVTANIAEFRPKAVLISGMGGSSNAAKILEGIYEKDFKVPMDIDIHNDYELPSWVDENTLVIANSYSGNTEETLSSIEEAMRLNARVIGLTTGGKIQEMINSGEISGVVVSHKDTNLSGFPKSGLGVSLGALMGILTKVGIINIKQSDLDISLNELIKVRSEWDVQTKANWISESIPVLFGGRPFIGALNAGRNAICEIGRTFTLFFDFPEVNHVLVEATLKPDFIKDKIKYIFFESRFLHDRVKKRYEITKQLFKEQGLSYLSYELKGSTVLSQSLELAHYCAWLGYYLSINRNDDPGPEPWILKLKEALKSSTN